MERLGASSNGCGFPLFAIVLNTLTVLTACGSTRPAEEDEGLVGPRRDRESDSSGIERLVCPSCARGSDSAGGESSDFSGNVASCLPQPVSDRPSDALIANLDATRAAYDGSFENSLRWRPQPLGAFWYEEVPATPSGYVPNTRISINVALGEPEYHPRPSPEDCGVDFFQVPAKFEVTTADRAIASTAVGWFRVEEHSTFFYGGMDLADVRGALDLHFDPAGGALRLQLLAFPEGTRGSVSIEASTAARPGETASSGTFLLGTFPDDRCFEYGFPVEPDAPLSAFDGQTAAEVLAGWNSRVRPVRGVRRDLQHSSGASRDTCNATEVRFDIGAPTGVCYASPSDLAQAWEGGFYFDSSDSQLATADGLIDLRLGGGLAQPRALDFMQYTGSDRFPPDRFARETGIGGVDPDGTTMLERSDVAFFSDSATLGASGHVWVDGTHCSEEGRCLDYPLMRLEWPDDALGHAPCSE
jgi:hypothetical protein